MVWHWDKPQQDAFQKLRSALSESATMAYFDQHKESEILVDASPVGLAGILTQQGKPIAGVDLEPDL